MTNEELTAALQEKMTAEQERYKGELLKLPPEEILKNAYQYAIREDIVYSLESHNLSDGQLSALLKLDRPLESVWQTFLDSDYDTMSPVRDSVEDRADEELRAAKREKQRGEHEETKPLSIREQLKEGGSRAAPERAGKPPVKER